MQKQVSQATPFTEFVLATSFDDIPDQAILRVQDLVLDLIGVGAASQHIGASRIARETAVRLFNTEDKTARARIMFDGRTASVSGAAYAGATQIDSLDAHDGYSLAKGHAGCGLLPAVLAFAERHPNMSGRDFLAAMVLGYEIACRAGVALHDTVPDYHTSGAWVAVAVAALGVRIENPAPDILRQAIGIAEYHGPRSQMMREIDNPTMLHDGSGWGSMVGATSAELALSGFTGAPAITVEREDAAPRWADLGSRWLTLEQNIKLYPICRWAHAPIRAALQLRETHGLTVDEIAGVEIHAFHEATRLARDMPESTGKAQYSISYPVAAALKFGSLGAKVVSGETFDDPDLTRLVSATAVAECDHCNANFPQDRLGRTVVIKKNGERLDSDIVRAPGEHTEPIERDGIVEKFHTLTEPVLSPDQANKIKNAVFGLNKEGASLADLSSLLYTEIS